MRYVTMTTLSRARAGDGDAFRELTDLYRRELQLHCYRILGSVQDAEDALQETLLAAWRGLDRFEERSSLRGWLYRIATNRCLNALRDSGRRPQPVLPPMREARVDLPEPSREAEPIWLEPYPDALLDGIADGAPGPEARYEAKEAMALAFVAGLQHLPPQQRAVLVLRDVLGFRAAEVAEMLDSSEASVNSALRRARTAFETRLPSADRERVPLPSSPRERELVGLFADAFERADIERVVELLTDDDRKSTRLNSSHGYISYAVFCLKKKQNTPALPTTILLYAAAITVAARSTATRACAPNFLSFRVTPSPELISI